MNIRKIVDRVIVAVVLVALWQFASVRFGTYWVSDPLGVFDRLIEWTMSGELIRQAGHTIGSATLGFLIGTIPGATLPFLLRRHPIMTAVLDPYVVGGYGMPKLALMPLLIIWFGIGIWSKVALVASISFFLLFFNTQAGIRSINPALVRMAEILGANEAQVARSIVWPAALPYIFAGIRLSLPFAIGGTAIAELLSSNRGLGYLIQVSAMSFDSTGSFTAIAALTIIVTLVNIIVNRSERRLFSWRPPTFDAVQKAAS